MVPFGLEKDLKKDKRTRLERLVGKSESLFNSDTRGQIVSAEPGGGERCYPR